MWIEDLNVGEKIKAKNYKTLRQDEMTKFAPKKPRYTSGQDTQREYGKPLVSNKGKKN